MANHFVKKGNYLLLGRTLLLTLIIMFSNNLLYATELTLDPYADGSIYTCSTCNPVSNNSSVIVSTYIQGVIKFSTNLINEPVESALISLNPYSLPLFDKTMDIYGYGTDLGNLVASDGNAGVFLGTWVIPEDLLFFQETFFDVTDFINSLDAPYVAFNLRTDSGTNSFTSLEQNYGKPAQLYVATVTESSSLILMLVGILGIATRRKNIRVT